MFSMNLKKKTETIKKNTTSKQTNKDNIDGNNCKNGDRNAGASNSTLNKNTPVAELCHD